MRLRRSAAVAVLLTVCGLVSGCVQGSSAGGNDRLRVALPFPAQDAGGRWTDDPVSLTRLGVAETLTRLDENQQAQPLLAQDWVKDLDRHWRIRLREDVSFHDGLKLTAQAAAIALTRAAQAHPPALDGVNITARAIGPRELLITSDRPDPTLLERLSAPGLAILSPAFHRGGEMKAAGTGPFKVVSERQSKVVRLDAFNSYWGGKPALSGVDARYLAEGRTRAAALSGGDVDVAADLPLSELPGTGLREVPLPRTTSLYLNTAKAPFADQAMRTLASGAIDREALVRGTYRGHADVARSVLRQETPAEAPVGGTAAGQRIVLATTSDRPELFEAASAVAESLRAKGFFVDQVVKPYRELQPDLLAGRFDAAVLSRSYVPDSGDPVAYFASDFKCSGGYNFARLCDPAVDAAISNVAAAPDRVRAATGIESVVLSTEAVVPLVHERGVVGYGERISGVQEDPYQRGLITGSTARR